MVVVVPRHLAVHHETPLEGQPVDAEAPLGLHHVTPESVEINVPGIYTFPDLSVRLLLLSPLTSPGPKHFAFVGCQLDVVNPPGAPQLKLLEVLSLSQLSDFFLEWWMRRGVGRIWDVTSHVR